jgi:hypothetical protein
VTKDGFFGFLSHLSNGGLDQKCVFRHSDGVVETGTFSTGTKTIGHYEPTNNSKVVE